MLIAWGLFSDPLSAQIAIRLGNEFGVVSDSGTVANDDGAILKTDPDLEASLATAQRFQNDGNFRVASQLYQAVLQRSGDALYSSDNELYFSLVRQVEQILSGLPPEGLAAYRVIADAEAKELLAQATDPLDPTALNQIVNQYFISSYGDDAAFQLGCIYLDRFDFIGARRMFEKILEQYPDPSVSREQVLLRLALCQSYLGQLNAAQSTIAQAEKLGGQGNELDQIKSSLGELTVQYSRTGTSNWWFAEMGHSHRGGVMPALPADYLKTDLMAAWQYYFEPDDKYDWKDAKGSLRVGKSSFQSAGQTQNNGEEKLISSWTEKQWRPAGNLMFDGDRIYFKSAADMTVWDSSKVEQLIKSDVSNPEIDDAISWRSVWRNHFEVDSATRMIQAIRQRYSSYRNRNQASTSNAPESTMEVHLFGDAIHHRMSIVNGTLYSLEGKPFDQKNRYRPENVVPNYYNQSYRRSRSNFLTAYDAQTGEVQWTLPQDSDDAPDQSTVDPSAPPPPWIESGGFMSAPVGFGDLILVPLNHGGSISVYALDPANNGKTVWKSFLCDEPESGAESWSAIDLTLDGSDLFVNAGMGVVFVLDPATGRVRFAKRYERAGINNRGNQRGANRNRLEFDGWSCDVVIPFGRQMICFCSDADFIRAIDRNTGQLIWETEMSPIGFKVDYLLGIHQDILYAAGQETIIAYDLKGEGRMIWGAEQMFGDKISYGRGALTPEGIYMPVEDAVYQFRLPSLEDPRKNSVQPVAKVQVQLGTDAPLGNLFSDGKRLWVHGGNRLYALAPKP